MRHRSGRSPECGNPAQKSGNAAGPLRHLRIAAGRIAQGRTSPGRIAAGRTAPCLIAPSPMRLGLTLLLICIITHALADPCRGLGPHSEAIRRREYRPGQTPATDNLQHGGHPTPLERAVDAETYCIIPGDLLHVGIWGESSRAHQIRVSPEGDLLIPDVGPVRVTGRSLREAESVVTAALRPYYSTETVTVRLLAPGLYRIAVTGMVASPGMVKLTSIDRLTDALEAAGGLLSGASLRRITLRSAGTPFAVVSGPVSGTAPDGASTRDGQMPADEAREVDLLRWFLDGDQGANPVLAPGLAVDVPVRSETVRIRGPVNMRILEKEARPRTDPIPHGPPEEPESIIEWKQGDTVGRILAWQGGLSQAATGRATLLRRGSQRFDLDLTDGESPQTLMLPGDLLEIEYGTRWIYVVGSVRSPGRLTYLPGLTALDYVAMAGGATELGRATTWRLIHPDGTQTDLAVDRVMDPGSTVLVPERRTHAIVSLLYPLSTATAVVISVIALTR